MKETKKTTKTTAKAKSEPVRETVKAEATKVENAVKSAAEKAKPAVKAAAEKAKPVVKAAKEKVEKAVSAKKTAAEKITVQFGGKSYSTDELVKIAKDVWKYDLEKDENDFKSVELFVKPEESMVYYVINEDVLGSFAI